MIYCMKLEVIPSDPLTCVNTTFCTRDSLFTNVERGIFAHCNSATEQRILTDGEEDVIIKESRL